MLSELEKRNLAAKLGLFRDDGFGASKGSCQEIDDIKKIICEVFRSHGLEITVDANKERVKFLDVEFDLENNTFKPYIKENDVPLYVHKNSNHPPSITNNIPDSVNRRISALSSDEQSFLSVSDKYQQALTNSAYTYKLAYKPPNQTQKRHRSRKKGRLYFNPPYSLSVKTNVGKIFLQLIDKHFPKTNSLSKIVNRQKVKLSYRTTPNMKKIISSHNAKILRKSEITPPEKTCNCRQKDSCPVEGKCLTDNIIYQATVTTTTPITLTPIPTTPLSPTQTQTHTDPPQQEKHTYIGLTSTKFKDRFANHKKSFNHRRYGKETTLSQKIWKLKDEGQDFEIKWKILERAQPFSPITGVCGLCTLEKWYILFKPELSTLNKRNEINNHCFHKVPVLLENS